MIRLVTILLPFLLCCAAQGSSSTLSVELQIAKNAFLPFESIPVTVVFKNNTDNDLWVLGKAVAGRFNSDDFVLTEVESNSRLGSFPRFYEEYFTTPSVQAFVRIPPRQDLKVTRDLLRVFYPDRLLYGGRILDQFADYELIYVYECPAVPNALRGRAPLGRVRSSPVRFSLRRPNALEVNASLADLTTRSAAGLHTAMQRLALVQDERASSAIASFLFAEDRQIRRAAFEAAARWGENPLLGEKLIAILDDTSEPEWARSLAAECLGITKERRAIPALERVCLDGRDPQLPIIATRLLAETFESTASLPILRRAINERVPPEAKNHLNSLMRRLEKTSKGLPARQ